MSRRLAAADGPVKRAFFRACERMATSARMCATAALFAAFLLSADASVAASEAAAKKTFQSKGSQRTYHEFVPDSLAAGATVPLLILLHGSYSNGLSILGHWTPIAQQHGFVVVAPDASDLRHWRLDRDAPVVFRDLVLALAREHPLDTRRIYLFGHSGGAVYALTLSMLESEFFAATAVHAGAWRERNAYKALALAQRKIPIALFVGDRDPFFPLTPVRQTAAALKKAGHATEVTILRRHDHDYGEIAAEVNQAAWGFLREIRLQSAAKFQEYD